ncbi:hypothetical protein OVY29_19870 [Sphingopyxis sp. SE2]|jgi:hypothetical protein|uniref:hypothetical protein n=1 Tax=Sphingopyxis sp. SE2 TaxID=1586240 RepID=UPI0028C20DD0|nr:hypothetical protein [Sphingopyxis sp. SE2]MDT7530925.1 hypothetical protein [Sphingopyxis sp. SE2]
MSGNDVYLSELDKFVRPFIGYPAWGARQGYGSFLTFEFGDPELKVEERNSEKRGLRRDAYVQGEWHVWIYCCVWRFSSHGHQIAWSEDPKDQIYRATGMLDGQKLVSVHVNPSKGQSRFDFDLGGLLETWPVGDDLTEEQWFIYSPHNVFTYRADGKYSLETPDTRAEQERWLPFT